MTYILFTNYYLDSSVARQAELDYCFLENLDAFDHVVVICSQAAFDKLPDSDKIIPIITDGRPTFNNYFDIISTTSYDVDCINVIGNLDIVVPKKTLFACNKFFDKPNPVCLALTRWDVKAQLEGGKIDLSQSEFYNHCDSQDVWIFKSSIKGEMNADFPLGKPGCDNSIAYILEQAGYQVLNPSLVLKTYHVHLTDKHNYLNEEGEQFEKGVPPPYKLLTPTGDDMTPLENSNTEATLPPPTNTMPTQNVRRLDPRNPSGESKQ